METGDFGKQRAKNSDERYSVSSYSIADYQNDPGFTLSNRNIISQSKSSENVRNVPRQEFAYEEYKHRNDEDGYDSFLRKYSIDIAENERVENQDSMKFNQIQSYSNLIEQRKMEHNMSFSNNPQDQNDDLEDSSNEINLQNLDDLDLNYDDYDRKYDAFNETEPVQIIGK